MTMMPKARKTLTLLLAGLALVASVQSSAIKGQQPQSQPVQRLDEQAARGVKSPVQQYSDHRSPKSSGAPVLESSKKVYNDESIRTRSVPIQQQQQQPQQQAVVVEPAVAVKSAPAPVVVEPVVVPAVVPAVAAAPAVVVEQPAVPASVSQPVAAPSVVQKEAVVVAPAAVAQPQPVVPVAAAAAPVAPVVEPMKPTFVEAPSVVKASEELPPQSDRSAPIKEEKPVAVAVAAAPSVVVVEHVVPAKAPVVVEPQQAALVKPVELPMAVVVEPKPVVVAAAADSPLMAKKDQEIVAKEPLAAPVEAPIEVPAPDPGLVLSEPIDSTTKLLIDLDEHVQKFLPAEDKQEPAQPAKEQVLVSGVDYSPPAAAAAAPASPEQVLPISGKSSVPLVPYSSSQVDPSTGEPIVPPLPSLEKVEKASGVVAASSLGGPVASSASSAAAAAAGAAGQSATRQANNHHHQGQNQQQVITQLLDQLDSLQNRIQDTINQLVARRRYVMSALLRPMGTYVRRVRTNLERLQNRVNQLQAAAVSVGGGQGPNRPGGFVDAAAIETIRRRIDDISKRISDIVNRIRFSLTPTSAPLNSNGRK